MVRRRNHPHGGGSGAAPGGLGLGVGGGKQQCHNHNTAGVSGNHFTGPNITSSRIYIFKITIALVLVVQLFRHSLPFFHASNGEDSNMEDGDAEYQRYLQYYLHSRRKYHHCKKNITTFANVSSECFDIGREFIEISVRFTRKGRETGKIELDQQWNHLVEAEKCAVILVAGNDDSSFRNLATDLYITMGIIDRGRGDASSIRSRQFFMKALEASPNNREAKWHLSQLPAPNLNKQLGRSKGVEQVESTNSNDGRSVLCCVAMDEEPYIDEWVDFHLGIGFSKIIVYDNTDGNHLRQWGQRRGKNTTEVIHYPGLEIQGLAYSDCAKKALAGNYGNITFSGFWDVDEFLVLKKHDHVDDFLEEHLSSGALGINWLIFGPSGKTTYEPTPVTKRFVYREKHINGHVKSLARLSDMNMSVVYPNPHFPTLVSGAQHDTDGKSFKGAVNIGGPSDSAVLHHYVTKSYQEFVDKRMRGRADQKGWTPSNPGQAYEERVNDAMRHFKDALANDGSIGRDISGMKGAEWFFVSGQIPWTFDDSAWHLFKKVAPKYALYDTLDNADM